MRDDIDKVGLPASAKRYARLTSKDKAGLGPGKVDLYIKAQGDLSHQSTKGFPRSGGGKALGHAVKGARGGFPNIDGGQVQKMKECAIDIITRLLETDDEMLGQMGDVASEPMLIFKKADAAFVDTESAGKGMVAAIAAAVAAVGAWDNAPSYVKKAYGSVADRLSVYLSDIDIGGNPGEAMETIGLELDRSLPQLSEPARWALMKLFHDVAEDIASANAEYQADNGLEYHVDETRIVRSALVTHDGTKFLSEPGGAHIGCVQQANRAGKSWDDEGLGFETDEGKFVTRDQAELIGLKAGQLRPEIMDPGMVHAADFQWESAIKPFHYVTNCVSAEGDDITEMVDQAQDVTYEQFMRAVPLHAVFDSGIGYGYYWTPAQCVAAGVPYEEIARNRPLTLKKDWHISYGHSAYQGKECYFIQHSHIEYVFVRD